MMLSNKVIRGCQYKCGNFLYFNIYNNSVVSFILAMLFYLIFNVLVFLRTSNIVHYILRAKINKIVAIKRKKW